MLEQQGRVRAEEGDRMNQILTSLGKEMEEKQVGENPNEDCHEFTEDESVADPWLQARSKRRGSKLSPTLPKRTQQPQQSHHQPQRSDQEIQQAQQQQLQQQRAKKRRQALERQQKEREEAEEKEREEREEKEREEARAKNRREAKAHDQMMERARTQTGGPAQQQTEERGQQQQDNGRLAQAHLEAQELWSQERDGLLQQQQQLQQQLN